MAVIERLFPDFKSALAECGDAYNASDLAEVMAFKTAKLKAGIGKSVWPEQFTNTVLALGIAGADLVQRPLRVLDFGGGCGVHYFAARCAFTTSLRWAIVESSIMATHAKLVGDSLYEAYDRIAPACASLGEVDLVHASSAIQYVPDPFSTLDELIAVGAPYVAIARFPIWARPTATGVQTSTLADNGIGPMPPNVTDRMVKYPITFLNIEETMAHFEKAYSIVLALPSASAEYQVNDKKIPGITLVFRRNA